MKNKFEILKKTRPKLKIGDCFYYSINSRFYIGVVIQSGVYMNNIKDAGDAINGCLFLDLSYDAVNDFKIEDVKHCIAHKKLLIPPVNINKKGWSNGFFINNARIDDFSFASPILSSIRFIYSKYNFYDINYNEALDVNSYELAGEVGVYAVEGIEALLQISLDLDFSSENPDWFNPYEYYGEIIDRIKEPLPVWYHKAKKRLGK